MKNNFFYSFTREELLRGGVATGMGGGGPKRMGNNPRPT